MPGGVAKTFIPTRDAELKGAYDEWLARIVCFAFSISPQAFLAQMNRATAETAQQAALAEGLAPIQTWVKQLVDHLLITEFDAPDLEFCWRDERDIDPQQAASVAQIYVAHGIKTVNEARSDLGLDPVAGGDVPLVFTGSGPVPLAKAAGAPLGKYSADQPRDERGRWTSGDAPVQIAANDDGSRSDAGGILPVPQGERVTLSPDPAYRPDLKEFVERIANAKPEDAPALRAEIRARYHDVGDATGGDALDRALSDAVEPGMTPADRQAILEGIAPYAKGNPEDVGATRDAMVGAILGAGGPGRGARFASKALRDRHFQDHGSDLGATSAADYEAKADAFMTGPLRSGALQKLNADGDLVRYDPGTDEFGVLNRFTGNIRTYYKLDPRVHRYPTNLDYFEAQ